MNVANPNSAMILGAQDMWGYDATVVRRYAEFMTWTQGGDPNDAMSYVTFTQVDPLFAMLRQQYVFAERGGKLETAEAPAPPMAHLQLISKYRVVEKRDAIFDSLRAADGSIRHAKLFWSPSRTRDRPREKVKAARRSSRHRQIHSQSKLTLSSPRFC